MIRLRCVDDAYHASLAVANLTTVVPNRPCVIDSHSEDGFLVGSGIERERNSQAYLQTLVW